ncbi:MAG: hypothetical protein ACXWHB_13980 [Usitatibacter sp.]
MNDTVDVLKTDGQRIPGLKASIQRTRIVMAAEGLLVEPGDLVQRRMTNGVEETYLVLDPGFHEGFHGTAAHYQMEVKKLDLPEARHAVHTITSKLRDSEER